MGSLFLFFAQKGTKEMAETPEDFVDSIFVSFRVQDYNPFPIPGCNWVKEFEEKDIEGTLGDPTASDYKPTWMKDDWNGEMHSVWKFAGNHGFYEGGEWRLDPLMYEAFDDEIEHAEWDKDYVLHEYAFSPHDGGEWVRTHIQTFFDLLNNIWYAQDDPNLKSVDFHSYVHTSNGEYWHTDFDQVEEVMWNQCLMPCDSFQFMRQGSDVEMLVYQHPAFDKTRLSIEDSNPDDIELLIGRLTSTWGTDRRLAEKLPSDLQIWIRQPFGVKNVADFTEENFREALREHVGLKNHEIKYLETA